MCVCVLVPVCIRVCVTVKGAYVLPRVEAKCWCWVSSLMGLHLIFFRQGLPLSL